MIPAPGLVSSQMFTPGVGAWILAGCKCGSTTQVTAATLAEAENLTKAWRKEHPCTSRKSRSRPSPRS